MATRDSTTDEVNYLNSDPPCSLRDIIEDERTRLQTALTILGCTKVAINNDQRADGHQFCYGDMIELAWQMIDQTTNNLDSAYLRSFYDQLASQQGEGRAAMPSTPRAGDCSNELSVA